MSPLLKGQLVIWNPNIIVITMMVVKKAGRLNVISLLRGGMTILLSRSHQRTKELCLVRNFMNPMLQILKNLMTRINPIQTMPEVVIGATNQKPLKI